jgi:hypothetical protein
MAFEVGEVLDLHLAFRRLAASVILNAISDLSSTCPKARTEAAHYLMSEGALVVKDLGIQFDLAPIIANPPSRSLLKASNGRGKRAKLHGQRLRKLGRQYQSAVGVILWLLKNIVIWIMAWLVSSFAATTTAIG